MYISIIYNCVRVCRSSAGVGSAYFLHVGYFGQPDHHHCDGFSGEESADQSHGQKTIRRHDRYRRFISVPIP